MLNTYYTCFSCFFRRQLSFMISSILCPYRFIPISLFISWSIEHGKHFLLNSYKYNYINFYIFFMATFNGISFHRFSLPLLSMYSILVSTGIICLLSLEGSIAFSSLLSSVSLFFCWQHVCEEEINLTGTS